jgi:hypothetical protein
MAFFRQFVAPMLIVLVFLVALAAVSARIFLPTDMVAPAPGSEVSLESGSSLGALSDLTPALSILVNGLPDDPGLLQ